MPRRSRAPDRSLDTSGSTPAVSRRTVRWHANWNRMTLALAGIGLLGGFAGSAQAQAWPSGVAGLPVPCGGSAACASGLPFVQFGTATAATDAAGRTLVIDQTSQRAILNWESFNIAPDHTVQFNQVFGASASALNRIHQADPSVIAGQLRADGQIYLINANGVIFKSGAQVNASALIASTLNAPDALYMNGTLFNQVSKTPAFSGDSGAVIVESGALLKAAEGGKVMLFAPTVTNDGRIEAPGGQIILGAGQSIYLRGSSDSNLRGLVVEIDGGGTATNDTLGALVANRGNVMLSGLVVNQKGRISATTTVRENGTVKLLAQDTVVQTVATDLSTRTVTRSGEVNIAAGSSIEIRPDLTDTGTLDSNTPFQRSGVEVLGKRIYVGGSIVAPNGEVSLTAVANPGLQSPSVARNDSQVYVDAGAIIDVSGVRAAVLPMSRNQLTVELRGDELKDKTLQRDGFLRGKSVTIDVREGTTVADVSRQIAAIPRTLGEITATGGTIAIKSEGDVVLKSGAVLDVSGGSVTFLPGAIQKTILASQGRTYDISTAPDDIVYDGFADVAVVRDSRWGTSFQFRLPATQRPGYVQGANAGEVRIQSHAIALDATVLGSASNSAQDRLNGASLALGGKLTLRDFEQVANASVGTARIHDLDIGTGPAWDQAFGVAIDETRATTLDAAAWIGRGFSRFDLDRNGAVAVGQALTLPALGSFSAKGLSVDVANSIAAPGGTITLATHSVLTDASVTIPPGALTVRPGVRLSVAGEWVNESLAASGAGALATSRIIDAGTITLQAGGDLLLGSVDATAGVAAAFLDAKAGGYLDVNGTFIGGRGGSVSMSAAERFQPGVAVTGYGFTGAGTLALEAPSILVRDGGLGGAPGAARWSLVDALASGTTLVIPSALFRESGFQSVSVTASLGDLVIAPGTQAQAIVPYLVRNPVEARLAATLPNGGDLLASGAAVVQSDPLYRNAANLAFEHRSRNLDSVLTLGSGAVVATDPGGSITLKSNTLLGVDGTLSAPGGAISLTMAANKDLPFSDIQKIWLGSGARLFAGAHALALPTQGGDIQTHELTGPGRVDIVAERGWVIAQPGSVIDVSGIAVETGLVALDGSGLRPTWAGVAAGTITVVTAEGAALDGQLLAKAPTTPDGLRKLAAGGTFSLSISTAARQDFDPAFVFPMDARRLVVQSGTTALPSASIGLGDAVPASGASSLAARAVLSADTLATAGFDRIRLASENVIALEGGASTGSAPGAVTLSAVSGVTLDAPRLDVTGAQATIQSQYVSIGGTEVVSLERGSQDPGAGSAGPGSLTVNSTLLDVSGRLGVYGAAEVRLNATGDIRFTGVRNGSELAVTGELNVAQPLTFRAAQLYPTTFGTFTIRNTAPDGIITVERAAASAAIPASAGGTLVLSAPTIQQSGVIRAPIGAIVLDAGSTGSLVLGEGSETSTNAGGNLVLFGRIQNGTQWVYGVDASAIALVSGPTTATVSLRGGDVTVATGAVVDVSGGGDIIGTEFVPGPNGSLDLLGRNAAEGAFAIVPTLGSVWTPHDTDIAGGARPSSGSLVTFANVGGGDVRLSGIAAGTQYAVLPARYALLPGAFLVTPVEGTAGAVQASVITQADGSRLVTGQLSSAGDGVASNVWQQFRIESAATSATKAPSLDVSAAAAAHRSALTAEGSYTVTVPVEYRVTSGTAFFSGAAASGSAGVPRLPSDAGVLVLEAGNSLVLDGTLRAERGRTGARGAAVDIASQRILIALAGTPTAAGELLVSTESLARLGAESIFVGGRRIESADGTRLSVVSQGVRVGGDGTPATLSGPEWLFAAQDTVTISAGSIVEATGTLAPVRGSYRIGDSATQVSGDAGFIRVASGARVTIQRENAARATGDVQVLDGASLRGVSIDLDATRENSLTGELSVNGGALTLGAGRISLGDVPAGTGGLVVDAARIAAFNDAGTLVLRSYSSIDLYGTVALGSADRPLGSVVLDSAGIVAAGAPPVVAEVFATDLRLVNDTGIAMAGSAPAQAGSALRLHGTTVTLGSGDKAVRGFETVLLDAQGDLRLEGAGALEVSANTTFSAARVVTSNGARHDIAMRDTVSGTPVYYDFALTPPANAVAVTTAPGFGGRVDITAGSIRQAGTVVLPGGGIVLEATGPGGVTLAAGSVTDASGAAKEFDGRTVTVAAGSVTLRAVTGGVVVEAGSGGAAAAIVDVSARGAGDAGTLRVEAPSGSVSLLGELRATHGAGAGGRFVADAATIAAAPGVSASGLEQLTARLNASGFDRRREIRLRSGDLVVGPGADAVMRAAEIVLSADGGSILIDGGMLDASGVRGGVIDLSARDGVAFRDGGGTGARMLASGSEGDGGAIRVASASGAVTLDGNYLFDASAGTSGRAGTVDFRVPVNATRDGVLFSNSGTGTFRTRDGFAVEGFQVFQTATLTTAFLETGPDSVQARLNAFMSGFIVNGVIDTTRVEAALGAGGRLIPGAEIRSSGTMTLSSQWNLNTTAWKPGGVAGHLVLRAADTLTIAQPLSDGFTTAVATTGLLAQGDSWSFTLVGGADLSSAALTGRRSDGIGDFVLRGPATSTAAAPLVRTGNGDIVIAAAGDIDIGRMTGTTPNSSASVIYTAGVPSAALTNFVLPTPTATVNYPEGGGDVTLLAGGDIRGATTHQIASEWLQRQGQMTADGALVSGRNPTWWINYQRFQQNVGALGGGDVRVEAGGSIENLSAVVPTTGRVQGAAGTVPTAANLVVTGGGDLAVTAGEDIHAGFYYVARGEGAMQAGGEITAGTRTVGSTNSNSTLRNTPVATIFALGDASLTVSAVGRVEVGAVVNPTVVAQDSGVVSNALTNPRTYFFTYSPDSRAAFQSVAGDVALIGDVSAIQAAVAPVGSRRGINFLSGINADLEALRVYPATLDVSAVNGSIEVRDWATLYPSSQGGLGLFAGNAIAFRNDSTARAYLNLSDADPALLPSPLYVPSIGTAAINRQVTYRSAADALRAQLPNNSALFHATTPVYSVAGANTDPVRVVALNGDLEAGLILAKPARLYAGGDIIDLDLSAQHLSVSSTTEVVALGDIRYSTSRNAADGSQVANLASITVGGPGRVLIQAGGDVDLGNSGGIVSRGNIGNPYLPVGGASVSVTAGMVGDANLDAFLSGFQDPSAVAALHQDRLITYVRSAVERLEAIPAAQRPAVFSAAMQRYAALAQRPGVQGPAAIDTFAEAFSVYELLPVTADAASGATAQAIVSERGAVERDLGTSLAMVRLAQRWATTEVAPSPGLQALTSRWDQGTPDSIGSAYEALQALSGPYTSPQLARLAALGDTRASTFLGFANPGANSEAREARLIQYVVGALEKIEQLPTPPEAFRTALARLRELRAGSSDPVASVVNTYAEAFSLFETMPSPTKSLQADATVGAIVNEKASLETALFRDLSLMRRVAQATGTTPDSVLGAFDALPDLSRSDRRALAEDVLYDQMRLAGRVSAQVSGTARDAAYELGYRVSEAWFGPRSDQGGDLSLLFSQIKTEAGGNIHLLVPGGAINAGQTTPPAESGSSKQPDELGIIVQEEGAVRAFLRGRGDPQSRTAVSGDFAVNESRVFTLGGGDIFVWSTDGSIDAGRGAKTAVSAPPPILVTDANGVTTFRFRSASGSGIRSVLTNPDVLPGAVDLYAPTGIIDAGDAGIEAAGTITVGAQAVNNAANISGAGGSNVRADTSGVNAGALTSAAASGGDASKTAANASQSATSRAQEDATQKRLIPSFLTVEVLGYGE